ncbi:ADP-ribosylglycohydrolase family protein [Aliidiomarina taiwanensis]|nr:ADP-ribosylglycohydrolase family protein [Aliidiomarina taiwanensis]
MQTITGAILGDFVGSVYEAAGIKGMMLPLVLTTSHITDDSMMTLATYWALTKEQSFAPWLKYACTQYPQVGFGATMEQWAAGESPVYLNANSNGAAIRISPIASLDTDLHTVLALVEENAALTHTGEDAITGARALAEAIYLARQGISKDTIRSTIERTYAYSLDYDIDALFHHFEFTTAAAETVPVAICLGLIARDPIHCLRLGLHVGGDTDSITSMATALAASFPGAHLPTEETQRLLSYLALHYPEFVRVESPLQVPLYTH